MNIVINLINDPMKNTKSRTGHIFQHVFLAILRRLFLCPEEGTGHLENLTIQYCQCLLFLHLTLYPRCRSDTYRYQVLSELSPHKRTHQLSHTHITYMCVYTYIYISFRFTVFDSILPNYHTIEHTLFLTYDTSALDPVHKNSTSCSSCDWCSLLRLHTKVAYQRTQR